MIKLIVGHKGSGKTKTLINMANEAVKTTKGNTVCVEKGLKMNHDLSINVRLIDIEEYQVSGFDAFYGFLAGILAGNYDITEMFIDGSLKVGGNDLNALAAMIEKLVVITRDREVNITFTVSCGVEELPSSLLPYMI